MKAKLTEALSKNLEEVDERYKELSSLDTEIELFEKKHKDSKILLEYIELLNKKEQDEEYIKENKNILYESMLKDSVDTYKGKNIIVTLKYPYDRRVLKDEFFDDNPVGSELFNKYIKLTKVKGNITIKGIE